jgi:hypothetical protein
MLGGMSSFVDLKELQEQLKAQSARVEVLHEDLVRANARLKSLLTIYGAAKELSDADGLGEQIPELSETEVLVWQTKGVDEIATFVTQIDPPSNKRVKSTQMMADLVIQSGRAWSREELHAGFRDTYGIPEGWTAPANAMNNAIGRAVEKGLIHELDGKYLPGVDATAQEGLDEGGAPVV